MVWSCRGVMGAWVIASMTSRVGVCVCRPPPLLPHAVHECTGRSVRWNAPRAEKMLLGVPLSSWCFSARKEGKVRVTGGHGRRNTEGGNVGGEGGSVQFPSVLRGALHTCAAPAARGWLGDTDPAVYAKAAGRGRAPGYVTSPRPGHRIVLRARVNWSFCCDSYAVHGASRGKWSGSLSLCLR